MRELKQINNNNDNSRTSLNLQRVRARAPSPSRSCPKPVDKHLDSPSPVFQQFNGRTDVAYPIQQGRSPSGFWSGSRSGCNANHPPSSPPPPPSPTHNNRSQLKNGTSQSTSHSVLVYSPKNKYAVQVYTNGTKEFFTGL